MPIIRCLVVWALGVIMDIFSPTNEFIRVDLPALGFPIILTNPALCDIFLNFIRITKKQNISLYSNSEGS